MSQGGEQITDDLKITHRLIDGKVIRSNESFKLHHSNKYYGNCAVMKEQHRGRKVKQLKMGSAERYWADTQNSYERKEDMEQHYVVRQPGMNPDDNPGRFFIFSCKCDYWFKQNQVLAKHIRVIFTSCYRLQNQSLVKQFRMLFILYMQVRKLRYLKQKIYREVSNGLKDSLVEFGKLQTILTLQTMGVNVRKYRRLIVFRGYLLQVYCFV